METTFQRVAGEEFDGGTTAPAGARSTSYEQLAYVSFEITGSRPGRGGGGVEAVAGEKDGATKKQMALDAVGLSSAVADLASPEHKPTIDAATSVVSNAIDGIVAVANTTGAQGSGCGPGYPECGCRRR
jgi:hypothetical protein